MTKIAPIGTRQASESAPSLGTVFNSPITLSLGVTRLSWSRGTARTLPKPACNPTVDEGNTSPGAFASLPELLAYTELLRIFPPAKYTIFSNVPLSSIFAIDKDRVCLLCYVAGWEKSTTVDFATAQLSHQIGNKCVDLLVVENEINQVVVGVETDSKLHVPIEQVEWDEMKSNFFRAHRIPLLRIYGPDLCRTPPARTFKDELRLAYRRWGNFVRNPSVWTLQLHMPNGHQEPKQYW